MSQGNYRVAIDIGTTKVCTIIVRKRADHRVEVCGISIVPCDGMSKGMVAESASVTVAIKESVEAAAADAGVEVNAVYTGQLAVTLSRRIAGQMFHDLKACVL